MPQQRRALLPFAALSASYFAHIGFFNPYLPLCRTMPDSDGMHIDTDQTTN